MAAPEMVVLSSPDSVAHTNSCGKVRYANVSMVGGGGRLTIGTILISTFRISFFFSLGIHPLLILWQYSPIICGAMSMSFARPALMTSTAASAEIWIYARSVVRFRPRERQAALF